MIYRDQLDSAYNEINRLEGENAELKLENDRLKNEKTRKNLDKYFNFMMGVIVIVIVCIPIFFGIYIYDVKSKEYESLCETTKVEYGCSPSSNVDYKYDISKSILMCRCGDENKHLIEYGFFYK